MDSYHQDRNLGKEIANLPRDIDTVQVWHLIVQHDEIGRSVLHSAQSFGTGSRFTADLPRSLLLQNRPQIVPDGGIVIDQQNTNHQAPLPTDAPRISLDLLNDRLLH